jgi:ribonuclease P/MRP protein subunit POP5
MVRYKKRYFVIQLDRESDLVTQLRKIQESHPNVEGNLITDQNSFAKDSKKKRKKQKQCNKPQFKRALIDPNPLYIPDNVLTATLKELVGQIHGDFGRASVATGLRTIYSNAETRLCMIQTRHGPHRLLGSSLPFLTKIKNEKVVPRLIYTGATVRNCYQKMMEYQKEQLNIALRELGTSNFNPNGDEIADTTDEKVAVVDTEESIEDFTKNALLEELRKKLMKVRSINPNELL